MVIIHPNTPPTEGHQVATRLDKIFNTIGRMTTKQLEDHFSNNPTDAETIRAGLPEAERTGYHPGRYGYFKALAEAYLGPHPNPQTP